MAKIGNIQEVRIDALKPYKRNAKKHSPEQVRKIADSIEEFGFLNPILIDKDHNVIAGHGRIMASKELGKETVPCLYVEGLTDEQRRAYILADNRLTEMGEWDEELVNEELTALKAEGFDISLTGFSVDDIMIDDDYGADFDAGEADIPEPSVKVKQGQIYQLGKHRLMCGDSTNKKDVKKLMGKEKADLLQTDPPYNVDISNEKGQKIANDNMDNDSFYNFLCDAFTCARENMKDGASFYIWHADSNGLIFRSACEHSGLHIRQNLVWVKSGFTLGRQDYQWMHEPCLYGWKDGASHYFIDCRSLPTIFEHDDLEDIDLPTAKHLIRTMRDELSTVVHCNKPLADSLHPTMKPINLIEKQIRNSTREDEIVLDLFGGSGTTLLACEEMNRQCRMMEYDEHYAGVIIDRWQEITGEKAELING